MHGAASIMKQKNEKVKASSLNNININALIQEGIKKHNDLKTEAENQVSNISSDNAFNFDLEGIEMFKFQDKDYRD